MSPELLAELKAYVTPGASNVSSADDAYLQRCLNTAVALVDHRAGVKYTTGIVPETLALMSAPGPAGLVVKWTLNRDGELITFTGRVVERGATAPFASPSGDAVLPPTFLPEYQFGHNFSGANNSITVNSTGIRVTVFESKFNDPIVGGYRGVTTPPVGESIRISRVPVDVLDRAYVEVASELFNRRSAPNGISQFANPDGAPIRVARDPMVAAEPILAPYLALGFA